MKTPSFIELKTLVEFFSEELIGSQLQEVHSTEDGLVLTFYRFTKAPRTAHLVFDLDKPFPFLGLFEKNPWGHLKKTKPVGLFLNSHAKNLYLASIEVIEKLGRVVRLKLGQDEHHCRIEFRLIPKQANLIVQVGDEFGKHANKPKIISWYPVQELGENDPAYLTKNEDEARSIPFLLKQWSDRRGSFGHSQKSSDAKSTVQSTAQSTLSPYEKWKKNKEKDLEKKKKALGSIEEQVHKFNSEPWGEVGEFLKNEGLKNIKPEWTPYVRFDQSLSKNIQTCFEKAKSARVKVQGALARLEIIKNEIQNLSDLSEKKFEVFLKKQGDKKNKAPMRKLEGRFRKLSIESANLVCYMGKSAQDNIDLLRQSKSWDYWLHLKDYPSAHAIIHRQKDQSVSDQDIMKCANWLIKEGLSEKKTQMGGKFLVVITECRLVRPIKGDKLGRVTYHEARELLLAL